MQQTGESVTLTARDSVIHSDPEIASGQPVFRDTRVPVKTLFDHLSEDGVLDAFLEEFPTVSRDQAVRVIHMGRAMLETYAYGDPVRLDALCAGRGSGAHSAGQASTALESGVIHRDVGTVWGTPVFRDSRMPMRNLFDYLAGGYNITGFLDCFDTAVTREQAAKAIDMAGEAIESYTYAAAVG